MALLITVSMIFATCSKKSSSEDIDETMLYGTWKSTEHIINGQANNFDVTILIEDDGTGVIKTQEISHDINFTWSLSGDILTTTIGNSTAKFKIESLTESQITISGDSFPGMPTINTSYKGTYEKVLD